MTLYGYGKGDLVEVKIAGDWRACAVTGIYKRTLVVRPLDQHGGPWSIGNPAHLRQLSQEGLEAWLAE